MRIQNLSENTLIPVQNTHAFRSAFLWASVVVCLFLVGCLDEAGEHSNSGIGLWKKGEYDAAIAEFDKAIELNPKYGKAYYYRANVYYDDHQYSRAWDDVHAAQELGYRIAPRFLKILREASGRER